MLTTFLFIDTFVSAGTDWVAVANNWKKTEIIAKPLTMVLLFSYLALAAGFSCTPLIYFGLALFFSLGGDIFLLVSNASASNRWFLAGLAAFLLAHVAYIIALNTPFGKPSPFWVVVIAILLAIMVGLVLRHIIAGLRAQGLLGLVVPVWAYGTVITLMLLSAFLTFFRGGWRLSAAGLVSLGAILFFSSDVILAWNKFVRPVTNGRVLNMAAYHLGQIALITGVVLQFSS
jgi:uncharacterized membrane protein YhhN